MNNKRIHRHSSSGAFTLIELLLVVGIISLLVVINFIAVGRYRDKAKDTRVGATLAQIRSVATIIENDNSSFVAICSAGTLNDQDNDGDGKPDYPNLKIIEDEVKKFNRNRDLSCHAVSNEYCVSSPLSSGSYCVDSTGYAGDDWGACDSDSPAICH